MMNLIAYNNDGLDIYIDDKTGESFASISSYARMSELTQPAITKRVKTHNLEGLKMAQINTTTGIKTHNLLTENIIAEWIIKDNPTVAVQFLKLGIRKFMHSLAGYNQPQPQVAQQQAAKALPSEYDLKLKGLEQEKVLILKEIQSLHQKLEALEKQHNAVRLKIAKLEASEYKQAALKHQEALTVISELEKKSQQEIDDMYEKAFGSKDK